MTSTPTPKPLEDAAFDYIERGVSIIPIDPRSKRPLVKWKDFQDRHATEADIASWQQACHRKQIAAEHVKLAAVTGKISGFVIVDCDTEEAASFARASGIWSPVRVKTKHGLHLYFRHPMDAEWRPRVGSHSKGIDWPKLNGLDFRGDGSYALVPPSAGYAWEVENGFRVDDMDDWPVWAGWPLDRLEASPKEPAKPERVSLFADLDLSAIVVKGTVTVWEATAKFVAEHFPNTALIPTGQGNGRNQRVLSYASEQILYGFWGAALDDRILTFMDNFFVERLDESEWKATARSVEAMERANHPERFTPDGTYIAPFQVPLPEQEASPEASAEEPEDGSVMRADAIATALDGVEEEYFIRPVLPKNAIVQVVGYSGHGKSTLVQLLVHALTIRRKSFGPFEVEDGGNILYLNYEEGRQTIKERHEDAVNLLGPFDPSSPFQTVVYAPSLAKDDGMDLNTKEGLTRLGKLIRKYEPAIVVIDTVRSAFPGLDENDAAAWSRINKMCLRLRNLGVSVILLHHRNKPSKEGFGSYAGSTNQITVIETQVYVTQVYDNEETAKAKGGKYDGDYANPVFDRLYQRLAGGRVDWHINYVMEVEFGKVRNWTDDHDQRYWIGLATNFQSDKETLIALPSSKQTAVRMYHDNFPLQSICSSVHRRKSTVERWLAGQQIKTKGP